MQDPSVSIVIATFSEARRDDLTLAVESARKQTLQPHEIIVVVDHNQSFLTALQSQWSDVKVLPNAGLRGASGSRNTGVEAGSGDVVAFIDDDAAAAPTWLEQLIGHYQDVNVMGVGGSIEPNWLADRPTWFPEEFNWVLGCTYVGMPRQSAKVRNLIAANMSVRKDMFLEMGGFRKNFGKVGVRPQPEETELCIRLAQERPQGHWIYEPKAVVFHRVPPSRGQFRYFISRCFSEGSGKAALAKLVGSQASLSTERQYVQRTLPMGTAKGLVDFATGRDSAGLARAGAIVVGLFTTGAGYLVGNRVAERKERAHS